MNTLRPGASTIAPSCMYPGRGAAAPANEKRGDKVDVFDSALERVGERLDAIRSAQ